MLLLKKILLFFLSLFFIILFFIASSTSYAKSEYNAETLEKNVRFYTIEFLDIPDEKIILKSLTLTFFDFTISNNLFAASSNSFLVDV